MKHNVIIESSKNGSCKKVIVDGKFYPSLARMRSSLRISETSIYNYKRNGYTLEESISLALDKKEKQVELRNQRNLLHQAEIERKRAYNAQFIFEFRGKSYDNFSACCKHYAEKFEIFINADSLKATAKRTGESRQVVLERCIQKRLKSKFNPKKAKRLTVCFNSKTKAERCANILGLRCVDMFDIGFSPVRYYVSYKPIKKI